MKNILIISTGGTFNKKYNCLNGELYIDTHSKSLTDIASKWLCKFDIVNIIGKDSLEMDDSDRLLLLATINLSKYEKIIIIHGTDTIDITASYLADANLDNSIVITGAMVPYHIDPVEATANLALSFGYLYSMSDKGVYIAMNGVVGLYSNIVKDKINGKFVRV